MLNRVTLVGRLTRDAELRRTSSGKAVASFTLAVNRNFKTGDGQEADFISIVAWGKVAENTANYCSKGSLVSVDGRLQTRNYENNQGQKVFVTKVVADSVQFLETKRNINVQAETPKQGQKKSEAYVPNEPLTNDFELDESDIQF
jgi:single-strand DNA-binding protein